MKIFDLPDLTIENARAGIEKTFEAFPVLHRLYDDHYIEKLLTRRNATNFLLFMLVRPDEWYPKSFWGSLLCDLNDLDSIGGFDNYRHKLRVEEFDGLQGVRSEIAVSAWAKRRWEIELEPSLPSSSRVPEFRATSDPETWWEVKSLKDVHRVREDQRIAFDVQKRLQQINEPYIVTYEASSDARLGDVPAAVKALRRAIRLLHETNSQLPVCFDFHGFRFEVTARTNRERGYLGILTSEFLFTDEHLRVIRSRIADAAKQLPPGQAGVVVIDTTIARFVEDEDFLDACLGELGFGRRDSGGSFTPTQHRRISAAIHYKRDPDWGADAAVLVLHNPYATNPISNSLLRETGIKQLRVVSGDKPGRTRLEEQE
jgi:hypothetical protein